MCYINVLLSMCRASILYFILNRTGSQCKDFNKGVTLQNRGERVTSRFGSLYAILHHSNIYIVYIGGTRKVPFMPSYNTLITV